ncbi:hypothetical protein HC028_09995 [Planosporangium flavigriseum]|uniref:Uncharacterized protein n=1 Tax=Planosporangium flavigriseum TaxID=373681 RepID=A0A8J3LGS5_9ACTN|nr:hypothetical protein [Planosporangium flavigriseum]NJC64830.1 hypothetical protein [Planosporangium flavigriseum]GIG72702.1 hypothetical protein Pfl04_11060 [Planosporangium flavigriseum]
MKSHRTDGLSLAFGLVFLAAVGWWFFGGTVDVALPQLGWLLAAVLIIFGVLGLVGALRSDAGRKTRADSATTPDEDGPDV